MHRAKGWTRREALKVLGTAPLVPAVLQGGIIVAEEKPSLPPAYRGSNEIKPLPFDPAKLRGLSEKLITSHHQNNTHSLAGGTPILVMDMYEHSYHMDYGANAKGYIDAFFDNVQWEEVNRRLEEARKSTAAAEVVT